MQLRWSRCLLPCLLDSGERGAHLPACLPVSESSWSIQRAAAPLPVLAGLRRVGQYEEGERPASASELAGRILTTVYMGSEVRCCCCSRGREKRS